MEIAKRVENVRYAIRDVVVEAEKLEKQGIEVLHLNIGDPNVFDFVTPRHMIEAVYKAMIENKNFYANSLGVKEAKEAVLKDAEKKGIKAEDCLITTGVTEGIDLALTALANPGENVLTPSPGYPVYTAIANKLDLKINQYRTIEENEWQPDMDDIRKRIDKKTRAIVVINPNNPTGALYDRKTLEEIIEIANENDLVIFADEIYDKLVFDGKHIPIASIADDVPVLTFNGLSKNYLCPGWRIGWIIFSNITEKYKQAIFQLARSRLSSPTPFQYAIEVALKNDDHLKDVNKKLKERAEFTYKRLNEIEGLSCVKPKAAFYAFPKIEIGIEDKKFVMEFLQKKHVLTVYGTGFDYEKPDHFRIVFLPDMKTLRLAYKRLEEYMNEMKR
jgi:alanine-synthesizing transaminase